MGVDALAAVVALAVVDAVAGVDFLAAVDAVVGVDSLAVVDAVAGVDSLAAVDAVAGVDSLAAVDAVAGVDSLAVVDAVAGVDSLAVVDAIAAFTGQNDKSNASRNTFLGEQLAVNTRRSAFWQKSGSLEIDPKFFLLPLTKLFTAVVLATVPRKLTKPPPMPAFAV
ncbi:hypothetical protein [Endozoicomonas sp. ALB032]|uniref:hypothetical protein n=1 Tax=Endozoicomonas sp. ALB032 TaxID=3403082 RepID=UPI003BB538BF